MEAAESAAVGWVVVGMATAVMVTVAEALEEGEAVAVAMEAEAMETAAMVWVVRVVAAWGGVDEVAEVLVLAARETGEEEPVVEAWVVAAMDLEAAAAVGAWAVAVTEREAEEDWEAAVKARVVAADVAVAAAFAVDLRG